MKVNNRQIVAVYIRGLAFKCASGSRREQVLRALKRNEEIPSSTTLIIVVTGIVAWSIGILTAWWIL